MQTKTPFVVATERPNFCLRGEWLEPHSLGPSYVVTLDHTPYPASSLYHPASDRWYIVPSSLSPFVGLEEVFGDDPARLTTHGMLVLRTSGVAGLTRAILAYPLNKYAAALLAS